MSDPRASWLLSRMVDLYLIHGSVNKLCGHIAAVTDEVIYPNRVHALLSGKKHVSFNLATFETMISAVSRLPDAEVLAEMTERIRSICSPHRSLSIQEIYDRTGIPVAVLERTLGVAFPGETGDAAQPVDVPALLSSLLDRLESVQVGSLVHRGDEVAAILDRISRLTERFREMLSSLEE